MNHGPEMHGALFGIVVLVAAVGGLAWLVVARLRGRAQRERDRSER